MDPKFSDLLQSRASKKDPFAVHQLLGLVTSAFEAEEEGNDGIPLAEEASAAVSTRVEVGPETVVSMVCCQLKKLRCRPEKHLWRRCCAACAPLC